MLKYIKIILLAFCFVFSACGDDNETIPAEVYIVSTFVPVDEQYETTMDIWANNVLSCAGWTSVATHDTRVVSDFTSTEGSYKLEMRSNSTTGILWEIRIRVLDHISELDENAQRAAVVDKMCYYLKEEPDYETENKWVRVLLGNEQ